MPLCLYTTIAFKKNAKNFPFLERALSSLSITTTIIVISFNKYLVALRSNKR